MTFLSIVLAHVCNCDCDPQILGVNESHFWSLFWHAIAIGTVILLIKSILDWLRE